jgi:hypothetical protein
MKHMIAGLTSLVPALGMVTGALLARGEDDKAAVTRVLMDYYSAFSKLDVQAILTYFHEPSLLITPVGVAASPPTPQWWLRSRRSWKASGQEDTPEVS